MTISLTRKIAEGTALFTSSNLIATLFGLLTFLVIVRTLGRFEYGLIVLALSAVNITSTFLDFGIGGVITADVAREIGRDRFDRSKSLLYRYAQLQVFTGLLLFFVVFFSNFYFEQRYSELVSKLVQISAFMLLVNGAKNIYIAVFNSHLEFRQVTIIQVGETIFRLLYVLVFLFILDAGIFGVMASYPLSILTAVLLTSPRFYSKAMNYKGIERSQESLFFSTLTGHGKWVVGMIPFKRLGDNIPPWIIQFILGVEAVAIFQVARRVAGFIVSFISPLEQVLMPIIPKEIENIDKVNKIISRSYKYSFWLSTLVVIASILAASIVFEFLFGLAYIASVPVFRVLVFIAIIYAFNLTMRPLFFGFKTQKHLFIIYVLGFLVLVVLGSIFTLILELMGMAVVYLGIGIFGFLLRYRYIKRLGVKIEFNNILKIDDYDKNLLQKIKKELKVG
jgi:O-antigen/teichoic acid export membrane protein